MYSDKKIMIGLSGGINSMAVLCWLVESGMKPSELHLFYAHFDEHSPDTFQFVADGIRYARKHFPCVKVKIVHQSVIKYFDKSNMIPHPMQSPCTRVLKIEPINKYGFENDISIDLIGYVKEELKRRTNRQQSSIEKGMFDLDKDYPIGGFTDEDCFAIVLKHIGWFPFIYTLRWSQEDFEEGICTLKDIGKRIFKHNNCLPCKNMNTKDIKAIRKYYPKFYATMMALSEKLKKYWGRDEAEFYTTFGRELGQESTCNTCKF